jgi:hypothetical protein
MSELLTNVAELMAVLTNEYAEDSVKEQRWDEAAIALLIEVRDDNNVPMELSLVADGLLRVKENL